MTVIMLKYTGKKTIHDQKLSSNAGINEMLAKFNYQTKVMHFMVMSFEPIYRI